MEQKPNACLYHFFLYALTLLFIALKLMGKIDWSWWLVLLPLYGGLVVTLVLCLLVWACVELAWHIETKNKKEILNMLTTQKDG